MARSPSPRSPRPRHAPRRGPGFSIDSWNLPLDDPEGEGFVGDRASHTAFYAMLERARRNARAGADPFPGRKGKGPGKEELDHALLGGDVDAAHVVHMALEAWAREFAFVARCFLARPEWDGVQRIVVGGGMPQTVHGGLAMRRVQQLLRDARAGVELDVLPHDPDEAGLLGWAPLAPASTHRFDGFLAVDIGGTNYRCGIVTPGRDARDGRRAEVYERLHWRHAEDDPDRAESIDRIAGMLNALIALARSTGLRLAPFVGIACPGEVEPDGRLSQGTQNLPGEWEAGFHLPDALGARLDRIGGQPVQVMLHNDAVVQGVSALPPSRAARRWGVFTIGTGLGNASYTRLR